MYIIGQDRNIIFTLQDKGILKGTIYTKDIYINSKFYGTNICGRRLSKPYLLGTYEENEGEMVINEIYTLLKAGAQYYSMPAPVGEFEILGVML